MCPSSPFRSQVTSGEEDEKRILQTSCKLYQFCPVGKTWIGRGVGTLRLNEKEKDGVSTSRLVVRSKAVMRVCDNCDPVLSAYRLLIVIGLIIG